MKVTDLEFPEVFITGKLPKDYRKHAAVAAGLVGWTNCMAGTHPPENFGIGMAAIGAFLNICATPENLDILAKEILNKNKK